MKSKILFALLLATIGGSALALTDASSPPKFPIPWGNSAGGSFIRSIPTASQIGVNNGWASLTDGFPPLNFQPVASGGVPPFGQDMNGIFKQLSQGVQWQQAGAPIFFDSVIATGAGGYPKGAIVMSSVVIGDMWMSIVDSNSANPDTGGANWVPAPGSVASGDTKSSLSSTVPYGYVAANATTIGNAASNGTGRANADSALLFTYIWTNCPNSICPLFNSSGTPIARGGSAAGDYAANDAIQVYDLRGTGMIGADTMGGGATTRLAGVPITSGSSVSTGSILGENLHSLTSGENGAHTHGITDPGHHHTVFAVSGAGGSPINSGGGGISGGATLTTSTDVTGVTVNSSGSGTGHNTVQRSTIVYWNLKL